eukprot:11738006-Karenia_brevis.AAC.1
MPKSPVSMTIVAHWEHLAQSDNIFVTSIALASLCLLFGALHFAHLPRSCLLRACPKVCLLCCSLGTSSVGGSRVPYFWPLPR